MTDHDQTTAITPAQSNRLPVPADAQDIAARLHALAESGLLEAAQDAIDNDRFTEFNSRKSQNTLTAYRQDLQRFAEMVLHSEDTAAGDLLTTLPGLWERITEVHVQLYMKAMKAAGYAVSTCNRALYAVRKYAELAMLSGAMPAAVYAKIKKIDGVTDSEAVRVDENRDATRRADVNPNDTGKKADNVQIPADVLHDLLTSHDTETFHGLRTAVIIRMLAELGLRAGELAALQWKAIDLEAGQVTFYRSKVSETQTMALSLRLQKLLRRYMTRFPAGKYLIWQLTPGRKAHPAADPTQNGVSGAALSMVVKRAGKAHDLPKLSAHDLRHMWTTLHYRNGVSSVQLQRMGGWKSPAMLQTYIDEMEVTNEGHESPFDY